MQTVSNKITAEIAAIISRFLLLNIFLFCERLLSDDSFSSMLLFVMYFTGIFSWMLFIVRFTSRVARTYILTFPPHFIVFLFCCWMIRPFYDNRLIMLTSNLYRIPMEFPILDLWKEWFCLVRLVLPTEPSSCKK